MKIGKEKYTLRGYKQYISERHVGQNIKRNMTESTVINLKYHYTFLTQFYFKDVHKPGKV